MNTIQYKNNTNTIQYNTMQCNAMQHSTVQYNPIQYNTTTIHIQTKTIHYNTLQYSTVEYSTIQYNTLNYNTIQPDHTLARVLFSVLPGAKITLRCGAGAIPWSGPPHTTAEENQFLNWDYNRNLIGQISFVFLAVPWFS